MHFKTEGGVTAPLGFAAMGVHSGIKKEKPDMAEVLAVGPGGTPEGKDLKMEVKVGDIVLCAKYSGTSPKSILVLSCISANSYLSIHL